MPAGSGLEATTAVENARAQTRKSSKPIMEKRRRARINESLGHLKTLILEALKKDSSRHSKLEKADILEMTVKHLRNLQRPHVTVAVGGDPCVLGKYRAGFNECVVEVSRYLSACDEVNSEARSRLLGHLAARVSQMNAAAFYRSGQSGIPAPRLAGKSVSAPDGRLAFPLPGAALAPLSAQSYISPGAPPLASDSVWRPW
nr:transcription factor HES-1-like [Nerophis lumbriciformis]